VNRRSNGSESSWIFPQRSWLTYVTVWRGQSEKDAEQLQHEAGSQGIEVRNRSEKRTARNSVVKGEFWVANPRSQAVNRMTVGSVSESGNEGRRLISRVSVGYRMPENRLCASETKTEALSV
jgi:hypothetical protein